MFKFNESDSQFFKDVKFLIEADDYSQFALWKEFHELIDNWQEVSCGYNIEIGKLNRRPIVISINYAILNGKKVLFYWGCSQLVDHKMIEDWIKHFTEKTIRWDNNIRWAKCDAMNFHLCLQALNITANDPRKQKTVQESLYILPGF